MFKRYRQKPLEVEAELFEDCYLVRYIREDGTVWHAVYMQQDDFEAEFEEVTHDD